VRSTALLLVLPLTLLAACDSCDQKSSSGPAASASASAGAPSAVASSSAAPAPSGSVAPSGKMAHCPNAVPGAKTEIADVPGGVALTVTSSDAQAVADIRARIAALIDAQKNQGTNIKHTGNGEGGGLLGRCPIVLKETTVSAADVDHGSKVTVVIKDPQAVDWLRRETRDRDEDLQAAGSPAGAGKMAHCPSAIMGTTTTVKNTKDGVSVTVTAKEDSMTKSIRERVAHLVEIAKPDAGGPSHTGEGGGHGSIGRCPIVLKETTLTAKDVPGGSQVEVKAKSAAGVKELQDEAKERAEKFQLTGVPAGAASASASTVPAGSAPKSAAPGASH
jgi:TusA-related sulfurtransferase